MWFQKKPYYTVVGSDKEKLRDALRYFGIDFNRFLSQLKFTITPPDLAAIYRKKSLKLHPDKPGGSTA